MAKQESDNRIALKSRQIIELEKELVALKDRVELVERLANEKGKAIELEKESLSRQL